MMCSHWAEQKTKYNNYNDSITKIKMSCRNKCLPRILLILELCMSGNACRIRRLSSLAHTMKAFMGRLMWPEEGVRDSP